MSTRIDLQPSSGLRDYLPPDAMSRQAMMNAIASVFERSGFLTIDTPSMEKMDVLTGGDPEFKKQIYQARITENDEPLGLRFDLTVPLARYVAAHADKLQLPLSRYHIGKVWRGEHAQAGRYREFVQCDADIVGGRPGLSDAQILAVGHAVFTELGLADSMTIRISNRKILNGLAGFLAFDESKTPAVLRAIDKLDKQDWSAVAGELSNKVGLDDEQIDGIQEFLALKADSPEALLASADSLMRFGSVSHQGLAELKELIGYLDAFGLPRGSWQLDLSIARGLGYYTGTVFEVSLNNARQYGSVCSGGRYDDLVSRFAPMNLSGVGLSVGIDRLLAALDELGLSHPVASVAKLAVLDFDPECRPDVLALVSRLRQAGIRTALYLGNDDNLKGQLAWAVKSAFPYVAIMGKNERAPPLRAARRRRRAAPPRRSTPGDGRRRARRG